MKLIFEKVVTTGEMGVSNEVKRKKYKGKNQA